MSVHDIATGLVDLCKEGKFGEAVAAYYADDIVSVESFGEPRESQGIEAIHAKMAWWASSVEVHGITVEGPWVNEPTFIVKFVMDTTDKSTNERKTWSELALYSVHEGKIVHERFFSI
jgi:hypothetical protein